MESKRERERERNRERELISEVLERFRLIHSLDSSIFSMRNSRLETMKIVVVHNLKKFQSEIFQTLDENRKRERERK